MDDDHLTGTAKSVSGKVKEDFGRVAREAQAQIKGHEKQVAGAPEVYGQAKDAAAAFTADFVQRAIEQQPYTAVAIAIAVGWLLGRTHRPI